MSFSYGMIILIPWVLCLLGDLSHIGKVYSGYFHEINLLLLFLFLIMVLNLKNAGLAIETPVFPGTLFFNTFFLILLLLDFSRHPQDLNAALVGYAIGSMVIPILYFAGIGVEIDDSGRLVFLGNNSNVFGVRICFAIGIILQLFIIQDYYRLKENKIRFVIPIILLVAVLFASGSRTAFLCLLLVFASTVFSYRGKGKNRIVVWGIIAAFAMFLFLRGTVLFDRLLDSATTGDTSGRDLIWAALLPKCLENPVFGVGMTGYDTLTMEATGKLTNPHNVFLEIFAYSGYVGLSIYFIFWLIILIRGMKLRSYHLYLPLILFLPILVNLFCGHVIETKISYIAYAYCLFVYKNRESFSNI